MAAPPTESTSSTAESAAAATAAEDEVVVAEGAKPGDGAVAEGGGRAERGLEEVEEVEEEEEEEDVCRICRNPGDAENPLRYPCACSGSIKYVHQDCLLQWLNHSNARNCEVCKHAFSFSPVYADNAPSRLPFQEFILGIATKAYNVLQFFLRLAFVLSVWLLIIPFITFWIWRLTFVRGLHEAQSLFLSHCTATMILTDCLHGFLLSASIVFIFLGATSLRDYFRNLRELGGQDADREDEAQDRQAGRAARRPPGAPAPNRIQAGEANNEDVGGDQGIAGAGHIIRRNAENVAARLEMQAARLEAHVEQMFDGLDDADGADDVPFDELVGMQGPVFHLIENAITVLASNAIFLGFVIFLPFSLGRLVMYYVSWAFSATNSITTAIQQEAATGLFNDTLKTAVTAATNLSSTGTNDSLDSVADAIADTVKKNLSHLEVSSTFSSQDPVEMLKGIGGGASQFSDVTTLFVGYVFIFSLLLLYLGFVALIRYTRGEPLSMGRFYGFTSIAEGIPSLVRQFIALMKHLMTMLKVAFLLVIELGVFPLMCGWWLDVCTIKMLGTSISQRLEFLSFSPLASSLIHWLVGIVYMLQISIFVSLLRGVLRNGVLYFLRDPADPNYNPFRDLIDDPVHKHARRVLLSVAVYGSLIVMLVYLPVKLAMRLAPSVFPLDILVSDPFTEIPADMLLFQICIPFAVGHLKPRATVKAILRQWFSVVGWALGLSEFLLPRPEDNNGGQENVNGEPGRLRNVRHGGPGQQDRALVPLIPAEDQWVGSRDILEDPDADEQSDAEYGFVLRIVLLLVLAWMTLLIFNSVLLVVPVSIGRATFGVIPRLPISHGIKCNDLYAFSIGCFVIWASVAGAHYGLEYVKTQRAKDLIIQVCNWSAIILKCSALLSIWVLIIPVLIGLLFELLVIVPMRVPVDESPVFLLYQDWALGIIFLKIWTRLVMLDQMAPLVDESWRIKFERVREDGFSRLRGLWVLREIVIPIMVKLLTALCVPYVFARGLFPVFGYPLVINSAVYRFAWLGCLILTVTCFCAKRFHVWFRNLHNSIRDDRYLIGRRLHNYGEDTVANQVNEEETYPEGQIEDAGLNLLERAIDDVGLNLLEQENDEGLRLRRRNGINQQGQAVA